MSNTTAQNFVNKLNSKHIRVAPEQFNNIQSLNICPKANTLMFYATTRGDFERIYYIVVTANAIKFNANSYAIESFDASTIKFYKQVN